MADTITTRVEGLEEARAALEAILRAERRIIPQQLELIGEQAVGEIADRAPILTGRLSRSYTYVVGAAGDRGRWVEIGTNVEYAPYQEFGTSAIRGKAHVRPGIEATIRRVPALLAAGMAQAGRQEGRRWSSRGAGALRRTIANL